ncbi:gsl3566 [Gloeobacter violaceus PCC 7421]|uniref:Gsl3566 protein n=1 Tax=Gloeobacter violaceus (strain ATCC 29082 / PCC 7421) TaxID=251221 RepID=Q7NFF9_GLOVI|nr:gsl3566 [Gloeobacter violaceus PCC 7421]
MVHLHGHLPDRALKQVAAEFAIGADKVQVVAGYVDPRRKGRRSEAGQGALDIAKPQLPP